ncbi:hypothetical protein [uncultured Sphingomonas sp.]|uniref:hypothetical protein n=1 Tax=uncultured Sphingomonas sp. TaxID=158754 RepID=UPI0025EAFB70|nr:hypothetical protein [uncultured Sphingomonas sp.]
MTSITVNKSTGWGEARAAGHASLGQTRTLPSPAGTVSTSPLTRFAIALAILLSLLGWVAGRVDEAMSHAVRSGMIVTHWMPTPRFSVHLLIEVRP